MLGKILLLGLAIWLVLTMLRQYRRSVDEHPPQGTQSQDMVRCAHCGVHIPKSESIERDGRTYCCIEHSQHPPQ